LIAFIAQPGTNPLWLRALGDGLRRSGTTITAADTSGKLSTVFTRAATAATDSRASTSARLAALALLDVAPYDTARSALVACLAAGQPPEIQSAAIKVLAQHPLPAVTTTLIESWRNGSPAAREAVLAALIAREDRAVALLTAITAGTIKPAEIPAAQVQALTQHKTQKIAALARTALASVIPPSRAEVTATFQPALTLTGDAARGRAIYQGRCFVCHRAGDEGIALGPDLITVKSRGREALLSAILEPHKEVAPHYIAYDVTTKEGNTFTAMVARDDATGLTLKIMGGGEIVLPRAQVRGSRSDGLSLMPEGLEAGLKPGDMADLLTFIENLK
jgi:putative heme-binding domain-containing protein